MKKTLLIAFAFFCSLATFAQNTTYKYHFNGNLNELFAKGPALIAQCVGGTYVSEALPVSVTKNTYRFDKGCGLEYNDVTKNFLASGTYTIELYFRLDTITGYKKLVDFDSMSKDAGLYNQNGKVVLYPNFTSADSFIGANVWQYVAITRDGATKKMYISANGKSAGTYTDNTDMFILGSDKLLMFFKDDKGTGGEQSKGAVAMIQISNYVIDSNTVKANFAGLTATLNVPNTTATGNEVMLYPNPATDNLNVTLTAGCNYAIFDVTGKTLRNGALQAGSNTISLNDVSSGLYFFTVISIDGTERKAYKFTKE